MVNIKENQVVSFLPKNEKILDETTASTADHTCSLAGVIDPNAVAIVIMGSRSSGSGYLKVYPNSGSQAVNILHNEDPIVYGFAEGTLDFKFALSAANDDWDIYMMGEFIEGPVGK